MRLSKSLKVTIISFFVLITLITFSLIENVNPLFAIVMCLWTILFIFSIVRIRETPLLMCFLIAFAVFLLGRQFCFHYLHISQVYEFLNKVNDSTYICLIVSLLGIAIGIFCSTGKIKRIFTRKERTTNINLIFQKANCSHTYRTACLIVFYMCFTATLVSTFMQIRFVQSVGYLESYTSDAGGAGVPTIIAYLAKFTLLALSLYLATKPSKKQAIIPLLAYEFYACLTLLTGQRYPFIGISMYILIYLLIRSRNERRWLKRKHIILLVISAPLLMIFMTAYDSIRLGKTFSFDSIWNTIEDFFIQQGGSINVIRRTINNAEQLKDMNLVSFHSTYSALFENGISRRLFNITTYSGNSFERAMHSNDLAHRLSYIAYGNEYLAGKGTGSSYIAELLHDFGLIGVLLGSIVYGFLFGKVNNIAFNNKIWDGIRLTIIYYLLLSPRGSFDSFIGNIFNVYTLIGILAIFVLECIIKGTPSKHTRCI